MFGDNLLFAPKLNEFDQEVDVYLPQEATWYQFNSTADATPEAKVSDDSGRWLIQKIWDKFSKKLTPKDIVQERKFVEGTYVHRNLTDLELALYVRGGSIIPILEH